MRDRAAVEAVRQALADPVEVCRRLGLLERYERSGNGVVVCCPVHGDRHPSCSVHVARDRTIAARCWGCGWTGDVLTLIQEVEHIKGFRAVLERAAALARISLDAPPPRRELPPLPERVPPPRAEVRALLAAARPAHHDREAAAWLSSRALDPRHCGSLARVLPPAALPRWARRNAVPWTESGHRLVLPAFDAEGALRSVRARAVRADVTPKSLPPAAHRTAGYVLASPPAVAVLRSGASGPPAHVVVVEGEPDFLTWASKLPAERWAVIGLPGSGAWSEALAHRIPVGSEVVVRTDPDPAGDRYALQIAHDLAGRARVLATDPIGRLVRELARERAKREGRHDWAKHVERGLDDNARLQRGELPRDPREGTCEIR